MKPSTTFIVSVLEVIFRTIGSIPKKKHPAVSSFIGRLWFHLDKRHRFVTMDNLMKAYGESMSYGKAERLTKTIFANFLRSLLEMCWGMNQSREVLQKYINADETHHLLAALKKNKGVLVLSGHLGGWEFMTFVAGFEGVTARAVYRTLDFKPMDILVRRIRSRFGSGLIPVNGAMKKIQSALDKNEMVGLLMDQNADFYNGVVADFFNRPAVVNRGMAILALETGAPVVPAFLIREGDGYRFVSGPEIPLIKTGDRRVDIELNTIEYNKVMESFVRRYPEQWFWIHNKWKTPVSSPWPREK